MVTDSNKELVKTMKIACVVWIIGMGIFSVCAVLLTFNRMNNSDELNRVQIEQVQKLTEQIGKPVEIRNIHDYKK